MPSLSESDHLRRRVQRLAIVLVVAVIAVGVATIWLGSRTASLARQRSQLRAEVASEQQKLAAVAKDRAEEEKRVSELEDRLEGLRAELTSADAALDIARTLSPETTRRALTTVAQSIRVYIQVTPAGQKTAAVMQERLQKARYLVPRIEVVKAVPRTPQVRYFRSEDKAEAMRIADLVRPDLANVRIVEFQKADLPSSPMRLGHLELWF